MQDAFHGSQIWFAKETCFVLVWNLQVKNMPRKKRNCKSRGWRTLFRAGEGKWFNCLTFELQNEHVNAIECFCFLYVFWTELTPQVETVSFCSWNLRKERPSSCSARRCRSWPRQRPKTSKHLRKTLKKPSKCNSRRHFLQLADFFRSTFRFQLSATNLESNLPGSWKPKRSHESWSRQVSRTSTEKDWTLHRGAAAFVLETSMNM